MARAFSFIPTADHTSVFSFRGQVLPAASLLNIVDVELIYGGVKYILKVKAPVSRLSPALWRLVGVFLSGVDLLVLGSWDSPGSPVPLKPKRLGFWRMQA